MGQEVKKAKHAPVELDQRSPEETVELNGVIYPGA